MAIVILTIIERLKLLFNKQPVMDMKDINTGLGDIPRESICRSLKELKHHSSCNLSGRYHALPGTPVFDENGFWKHGNALFSKHGSLTKTLRHLINVSAKGLTLSELNDLYFSKVEINLFDTLKNLVNKKEIQRSQYNGNYVYTSIDPAKHAAQLIETRIKESVITFTTKVKDPVKVVNILLTIIDHYATFANKDTAVEEVYQALIYNGFRVRRDLVERVFERYNIVKKNS